MGVDTHTTAAEPKLITVVVAAQEASSTTNDDGTIAEDQAKSITALINGTTYTSDGRANFSTLPFATQFIYLWVHSEIDVRQQGDLFYLQGYSLHKYHYSVQGQPLTYWASPP